MALKFLKKPGEIKSTADLGVQATLKAIVLSGFSQQKDAVFVASLATASKLSVKQRSYAGAMAFQYMPRLMPEPAKAVKRMRDLSDLITETSLKQLYYHSSVTQTGMLLQCSGQTFKLTTNWGTLLSHVGGWKVYPGLHEWEQGKAEEMSKFHFPLIMEAVELFFEPVQFIARNSMCPVTAKYGRTPEKAAYLMKLGMVLSKYSGKGVHP